jgi:uncharacterized protein
MATWVRSDIEFPSAGVTLRGWLYRADGVSLAPVIVMAHGFSAVKEMYLDRYAEVFAQAGFAVLVFDHPNFGASDGEPRQEANPWQQIEAYRDAITYACGLPGIDTARVGVWGTSYSGGHVLVIGATDRRVRCVVSQVPTISGFESGRRRVPESRLPELTSAFAEDRARRMQGGAPAMRHVADTPQESPIYSADDAVAWFLGGGKIAPSWKNEITLRTVEWSRTYEPAAHIAHISPTPLLMLVGEADSTTWTDLQLAAYKRAGEPKTLTMLPGGHFDPYVKHFTESSGAARDFFRQRLSLDCDQ